MRFSSVRNKPNIKADRTGLQHSSLNKSRESEFEKEKGTLNIGLLSGKVYKSCVSKSHQVHLSSLTADSFTKKVQSSGLQYIYVN